MKQKIIYLLAVVVAIISGYIFYYHNSHNTDISNTHTIGVLLYAQQPIIIELWNGFKDEVDMVSKKENIKIHYDIKNADGDAAQLTSLVRYFENKKYELVYVVGLPAAQALKGGNVSFPVFFGGPPNPVESGLVPRLNNHGTNFTGTRYFPPIDIVIQTIKKIYPNARRIAVLHNPGESNSMTVTKKFINAAASNGFEIIDIGVGNAAEVEAGLRRISIGKIDGVFIPTDNLVYGALEHVVDYLHASKIPVFSVTKLAVKKGAMLSVATDYYIVGQMTAKQALLVVKNEKKVEGIDVIDVKEGGIYINDLYKKEINFDSIGDYKVHFIK